MHWDKGKALAHLLGALGLTGADGGAADGEADDVTRAVGEGEVLALYLGDDRTDEDAFRELTRLQAGWGVLVSSKVW